MKKLNKKIISIICLTTMMFTTLLNIAPLKVYAAGVSAFSQIEAQYFDSKFVFDVKADNWFNLKASDGVVNYICDKDYVVYDTIDFGAGGASGFQVNTSTYGGGGGKVQVILDNIEGNVLGECVISENYSWTTFSTSSCIINGESITGEHKVFLKFTGNAPMFTVKWFKFTGAATTSADATLSDLKVGGTTVSGFSAANSNYNVVLPAGTTVGAAVAQVTATKNDLNAQAPVITQATTLPGVATVAVTAEDATVKTYTINFTVATLGPTKSAFSQIEAVNYDSKSAGSTLIKDNGVIGYIDNNSYVEYDNIDFGTGGAFGFQVSTSSWGGAGTVQVRIDNPDGTILGESSVTNNNDWNSYGTTTCTINGESIIGLHKVFLKFVAASGNNIMFNVQWFKFTGVAVKSTDATLSNLKVGGTNVAGFSAANSNYNVVLPEGTTIGDAQAQVTATKNNTKAEAPVIAQVAELPGAATVSVTAEDGTTIKTYTINFTVFQASQFPSYMEHGNKVTFDSNGKFIDLLDNNTNIFADNSVTVGTGKLTGPGEVIYKSDNGFKSVSIDVSIGKWGLNFSQLNDLKAYEVSYNNGTYALGNKIDLIRKLTPNLMTSKDTVMATYVSTPISAGVKYLRIILPTSDYFNSSTGPFTDFTVKKISFESTSSVSPQYSGSLIDNCTDFSKYVSGVDTSNLQVTNLTDIWDIRTFTNRQYVARKDSKIENKAMTYATPSGKDIKSAYVEAYSFGVPSKYFQVWASRDGTNYLNITNELSYSKPGYSVAVTDFEATTINLERVPDGTKYIQVRLPAYLNTDITPRITKVAFMYGDEIDVNIDDYNNQPSAHVANISIAFATSKIKIDGTVETDTSGIPTGDWQDAQSINIAGTTDTNGDSHSSNIFFKYDYDNLYIGAQIKDPTPMVNSNTGNGIWNGDNLEIFLGDEDINYSKYPDKTGNLLPSDRQIVLSGGIDYGYQYYVNVNGISIPATIIMDVKKSTDGKGYSIEASIPLATLNIKNSWNGSPIILNAVLNDGGSSGRGQWGWTTNGESTKKQRGLWGLATFDKVSASVDEVSFTSNVNNQTQLVKVSGNTLNVKGKDVTMIVKDPSGSISNIDQLKSDANGDFTFTYNLNTNAAGNGNYTVSVSGEGISRPTIDTFNFVFDGTIIVAPVTPVAPNVTADDTLNRVTGMTTGMEYKLDAAGYVAYNATTFNEVNFSGNHALLVRVAAEGINPAGNVTTLNFTINETTVGIPGKPILSDDSGQDNGLHGGTYNITMNLWWGVNGSQYKLYENGVLIDTKSLTPNSPNAQTAVTLISGKQNGKYKYYCELINYNGTTTSKTITVNVTDALPGKLVLSNNNKDGDGNYKVTANMWWGINGKVYNLYENGVLIDTQTLNEKTPQAQIAITNISGRKLGTYSYYCEFLNDAGVSTSNKMTVKVIK